MGFVLGDGLGLAFFGEPAEARLTCRAPVVEVCFEDFPAKSRRSGERAPQRSGWERQGRVGKGRSHRPGCRVQAATGARGSPGGGQAPGPGPRAAPAGRRLPRVAYGLSRGSPCGRKTSGSASWGPRGFTWARMSRMERQGTFPGLLRPQGLAPAEGMG